MRKCFVCRTHSEVRDKQLYWISENQTSWHYTKGKWLKRGKFNQDIKSSKYQDKFGELAIQSTLTN